MKPADVISVLHKLGCHKVKQQPNGWVAASCPFASTKHSGGRDAHPSFGVRADSAGGASGYRCLTCGMKGSLVGMILDLEQIGIVDLELKKFVLSTERESFDVTTKRIAALKSKPAWNAPGITTRIAGVDVTAPPLELLIQDDAGRTKADITVPESDLAAMPTQFPANVYRWLTDPKPKPNPKNEHINPPRGLFPKTIEAWDLRWVDGARRITFPIRDVDGRLVGVSGRAVEKAQKPKFLHSKGFARDLYLFGEHKATKGQTGILVEGHFDVLALHQHGYTSAVAVMGSHLSILQRIKLQTWFTDIIIIPDGDMAGRVAAESWKSALHPLPVTIVPVPDLYDPDDFDSFELDLMLSPYLNKLPAKSIILPPVPPTVIRPTNDTTLF